MRQKPIHWTAERVAVTGGRGFLGKYLVHALQERGSTVLVPPKDLDLRDIWQTWRWFATHAPTVTFHLAARVGGIGANMQNPATFFYDNMLMGLSVVAANERLFNEISPSPFKRFVFVGTACAYPKKEDVLEETNLWSGFPEETNAPYGVAKRALMTMVAAYRKQRNFPGISVIPANLYGPGDNFDLQTSHVIPALIRKFHEAKMKGLGSVTLWGTGAPTRDFLYVKDCVSGLVSAAENYDHEMPINIGTDTDHSISHVAEVIKKIVGFEGRIVWDVTMPDGQPKRRVSVERAKRYLNFAAQTDLFSGLQQTYDWFKVNWSENA